MDETHLSDPDLPPGAGNQLREISPEQIDADALKILQRLKRHGYEAYLVGGCVRDLLLGRRPKDFDIATAARPRQIKRLFPQQPHHRPTLQARARVRSGTGRNIEGLHRSGTSPEGTPENDLLIRREHNAVRHPERGTRSAGGDLTVNALFFRHRARRGDRLDRRAARTTSWSG
jgi:poly(A) polymerase